MESLDLSDEDARGILNTDILPINSLFINLDLLDSGLYEISLGKFVGKWQNNSFISNEILWQNKAKELALPIEEIWKCESGSFIIMKKIKRLKVSMINKNIIEDIYTLLTTLNNMAIDHGNVKLENFGMDENGKIFLLNFEYASEIPEDEVVWNYSDFECIVSELEKMRSEFAEYAEYLWKSDYSKDTQD